MARYENGSATERLIYETAKKLFFEKGFSATSYEDICDAAHVNRSTLAYYYKNKKIIREKIRSEMYEKATTAAVMVCKDPNYTDILALSIIWYSYFQDANIRRFIAEHATAVLLEFDENRDNYSYRIQCFKPRLEAAGLWDSVKLDRGPLVEATIHMLDLNMCRYIALSPEDFNFYDTIAQLIETRGKNYRVPYDIIDATAEDVLNLMRLIPYDRLNIRW